jgi:hypothetical protein
MGEWRHSSKFLDLGTRRRPPVAFNVPGKVPRYPLDRRLGGPWNRSGLCGGEKNLVLPEIEYKFYINLNCGEELLTLSYILKLKE